MSEIYCSKCRFLLHDHRNMITNNNTVTKCAHPSNKKEIVYKTYYTKYINSIYLKSPEELNKNNDCPNFEGY